MLYLYVLLILLSETAAITFLKKFSISSNYAFLAIGILFYILVSIFLVKSFKYEGMGLVNVLWSAFSVVFVVSAGMIFFKETITGIELMAVVMILSGVVVLRFHAA